MVAKLTSVEERAREIYLSLPDIQQVFLYLLMQCGVIGDALAGTYLLMKDDIEGMEEMLLWMYDYHPSREQIHKELVRRVEARNNTKCNLAK